MQAAPFRKQNPASTPPASAGGLRRWGALAARAWGVLEAMGKPAARPLRRRSVLCWSRSHWARSRRLPAGRRVTASIRRLRAGREGRAPTPEARATGLRVPPVSPEHTRPSVARFSRRPRPKALVGADRKAPARGPYRRYRSPPLPWQIQATLWAAPAGAGLRGYPLGPAGCPT